MVEGVFKGGTFVIDMSSIVCTDLEDEDTNGKLVGHLKSADFFDVENHPTATFVIEKTIPYGTEKLEGNEYFKETYKAIGKITIKGITKPLKTKIDIFDYGTSISGAARLEIDRSDFGIRYGSGTFFDDLGDKLIHDEMKLVVNISALKGVK